MDSRSRRADSLRVLGTMAMIVGLLVSLLTLWNDPGPIELHVFGGIFVLTGVGLRIEAAILASSR